MGWKIKKYENLSYGYWLKEIKRAKHFVSHILPCYSHCPKSSGCKKLIAYREMQNKIRELFEPTFNQSVKNRRMKLRDLLLDARHLRSEIRKCVFVRKRLTRKGYNMWYE